MQDREILSICKALSNEQRLQIVRCLDHGERCACELLDGLNISQPTLSHHMKLLETCGLVTARRDGKWTIYSLSCDVLSDFQATIAVFRCCDATRGRSCRGDKATR
ncbi:MAG: metalloregulator ArsR/SmtB family transcription factor [Peptoniphilaceae bacterium]|nr:metalloregulator ArsR/SmtB family transcription factor [Peptoniphilaceae bacterium]MDY6085846.1 metalloregulator ArsR/SmtB family transcription factor [Peptoniphilaceae bacterium]